MTHWNQWGCTAGLGGSGSGRWAYPLVCPLCFTAASLEKSPNVTKQLGHIFIFPMHRWQNEQRRTFLCMSNVMVLTPAPSPFCGLPLLLFGISEVGFRPALISSNEWNFAWFSVLKLGANQISRRKRGGGFGVVPNELCINVIKPPSGSATGRTLLHTFVKRLFCSVIRSRQCVFSTQCKVITHHQDQELTFDGMLLTRLLLLSTTAGLAYNS